jgi:hypothetical protein
MRGGPLRLVATAGAAVTAGIFTLSMLSSVSLGAFQTVMENKRVQKKIPWLILNLPMYLTLLNNPHFSSPHHDRVTAMVDMMTCSYMNPISCLDGSVRLVRIMHSVELGFCYLLK